MSIAEAGGAAIVGGVVGTYRALAPDQPGNFSGVDLYEVLGLMALAYVSGEWLDKPQGQSTFFGGVATGAVANLGGVMGLTIGRLLNRP